MMPIQTSNLVIKQDKPEDDELRLQAARVERQRNEVAAIQKPKIHIQLTPKPQVSGEPACFGRFGWAELEPTDPFHSGPNLRVIPYLYRDSEKVCCERMIQLKLRKYPLHPDIGRCSSNVLQFKIFTTEIRLLNEINFEHCDRQFGGEFTQNDRMISLRDALDCYQFHAECHRMLAFSNTPESKKCGFLRINDENTVPFVVSNGLTLVPVFYFHNIPEEFMAKKQVLSGWDLAYLKFCCTVQGIHPKYFHNDFVIVISLDVIKQGIVAFKYCWPTFGKTSAFLTGLTNSQCY